ncbi:zinc finger BED domain-containing protein 4-like [Tachysurus ichikawai]
MPARRKRLSQFFGDDYRESSRDEWEQFLLEPCIPPDEDPIHTFIHYSSEKATSLAAILQAFYLYRCKRTRWHLVYSRLQN